MTTESTAEQGYTVVPNEWQHARERLGLLETVGDPSSIRSLEALGVAEGWRCLEVGAGGGSMTEWLCRKVGTTGQVVATDIDTRFLGVLDYPNLTVLRHDATAEGFPEADFDLVHTRFVLTHLPQRERVLQHMVAALKPGGWLLVEEPDYASVVPDPTMDQAEAALSQKCWDAMIEHLTTHGYDTRLGRRLYRDVCACGIADAHTEGWVPMALGGTPCARFWRLTTEQFRDELVSTGLLTEHELDEYSALLESPTYRWMSNTMVAVWGQKPVS